MCIQICKRLELLGFFTIKTFDISDILILLKVIGMTFLLAVDSDTETQNKSNKNWMLKCGLYKMAYFNCLKIYYHHKIGKKNI